MNQALRDIPPLGRWTLGLHLAWGLFLWLAYPSFGATAAVARPVLVASWFGTTTMFLVFGLMVASERWRRRETQYLTTLLVFDAAALAIVIELIRVG